MNSIDSYLTEIEARIRKKLPAETVKEIIAELRSNLLLSWRDLMGAGQDENAAALAAVESFGDAFVVANDLVRQHKGLNTRSQWELLKLPLTLLCFSGLVSAITLFSETLAGRFGMLGDWLLVLVIVLYGIAVFRTRRWLVTPIAVLLAGIYVFVALIGAWRDAGMPGAPTNSAGRRATLASQRKYLEFENKYLRYARAASAAAISGRTLPVAPVGGQMIPVLATRATILSIWGVRIRTNGQIAAQFSPTGPKATEQDKASAWKRFGLAAIRQQQEDDSQIQTMIEERESGNVLGRLTRLAPFGIIFYAIHVGVLALLNWAILWIAFRWEVLRNSRATRLSA